MTYELMDRGSAFSPLVSKERLLSPFSVSVSSLSSGFLHLLLPCSADFICRKLSKDRKAVPASFLFLFSFFFIFFLFYCLPSRPHSNTGEGKKLPLFSMFFFSRLLPASLSYFSSPFSFLFFLSALPFFFCPFARSLEGVICSLTYIYLGKIQCINSRM